jgi:hypothetical protein
MLRRIYGDKLARFRVSQWVKIVGLLRPKVAGHLHLVAPLDTYTDTYFSWTFRSVAASSKLNAPRNELAAEKQRSAFAFVAQSIIESELIELQSILPTFAQSFRRTSKKCATTRSAPFRVDKEIVPCTVTPSSW